jgi:hypothetical protein
MPTPERDPPSLEFNLRAEGLRQELQELPNSLAASARLMLLVLPIALSAFALATYHVPFLLTLLLSTGVIYLVAAIGWPRWVYLALRGMRWFSRIADPVKMRLLMLVIGLLLLLAGIAYPFIWLASGSWL